MEERIGKRINTERVDEALGTDPDTISTGCPYCLVMLGDAVSAKKSSGEAKESLEVVDVAQLLARSVQLGPTQQHGQLEHGQPERSEQEPREQERGAAEPADQKPGQQQAAGEP